MKKSAKQKRMEAAVKSLTKFMATYDQQPGYLDYSDKTFVDDVLYGLGIALDEKYFYVAGFEMFKERLRNHLAAESARSKRLWKAGLLV